MKLKNHLPPEKYEARIKTEIALLNYDASDNIEKAITGMKNLLEEDKGKMPPELMSECYLNLGKWDKEFSESKQILNKIDFQRIINCFKKATECNNVNISAWHYFALLNYESANYLEQSEKLVIDVN
jgi:tetratricopeptide (TPR) repeat protein